MANKLYINYDGKLFTENEKLFSVNNRAFKYGDAVFETIRIINGNLCFLTDHFERLKKGIQYLRMNAEQLDFDKLTQEMNELIKKNKIKAGGRLRISVFRTADGFYVPLNQSVSYTIEAKPIEANQYLLNSEGLKVDIFSNIKRSTSKISNVKTANNILQILAGIHCIENHLDDCIITNKFQRIVETTSSNIFLFKKNSLYTPELGEGCMDGVLRKQILKIAEASKINIFEGMLNASSLLQTDEVFITNVVKGVQWVKSYKEKTYTHEAAQFFVDELNKLTQSNCENSK